MSKKEELFDKLAKAIIGGNGEAVSEISQEILTTGIDPLEAINKGALKGLDTVGERYNRLEAFLPELVLAGDAMKACTAVLTPHISAEKMGDVMGSKVVLGTVAGDIHDIGKSMVATMMTVRGFEVYDLGIDVPIKKFIEKAEEVGANVIAMSALLTLSAFYQDEVIKYLKDAGLRNKYYTIVGGAAASEEWAAQIGADGYGKTAVDGGLLVKRLLTEGVPPPLPQPLIIK